MLGSHGLSVEGTPKSIGVNPKPFVLEEGAPDVERRIRLWQTSDNIHCSVVGTCASVKEIRRLAEKFGLRKDMELADYNVHGAVVKEVCTDNAFSRAFHKAMDQRHAGAIRRVSRLKDEKALTDLWIKMRDSGHIASAYWAFMTHRHVPRDLRYTIFGEVHMLSHLAGSNYRHKVAQSARLEDMLEAAEDRARRVEAGLREAIDERDSSLDDLRRENQRLRAQLASMETKRPDSQPVNNNKLERRLAKAERAVVAARFRARQAEAQLEEQTVEFDTRNEGPHDAVSDHMSAISEPNASAETPVRLAGRSVLYVGGRTGNIPHLRAIAAEYDADLIYHDGGLEDSVHRLDSVLPSVECVFCPINCVSHDACIRARRACRKFGKPFKPLRAASKTALRLALTELAGQSSASPSQGEDHAG